MINFRESLTDRQASTPERLLANYSPNGASPANPMLVQEVQRLISAAIYDNIVENTPEHFSQSQRKMIESAEFSTASILSMENKASFDASLDIACSSLEMEIVRDKYARGIASGSEGLKLMLDVNMKSAEFIKRTHPYQEPPEDLKADIRSLYETILSLQQENDVFETFDRRIKIKQIDRNPGQGGLEGIVLSSKINFATLDNRNVILTEREKIIVDVNAMPVRWRSLIRKCVSTATAPDAYVSETDYRKVLYERLLDIPNPENSNQTLRTINLDEDFMYDFATTIYGWRRSE